MRIPLTLALLAIFLVPATAQSSRTACMGDYRKLCSQHAPGSDALKACMKENVEKLSPACKEAIKAEGKAN